MNNLRFKTLLKAMQKDDQVILNHDYMEPYLAILEEISNDVVQFKNYTIDGRLENILIFSLKDIYRK